MSDALTLEGADPLVFEDGVAWARVISETVDVSGQLDPAMTPVDEATRDEIDTEGVPVTSVTFVWGNAAGVWSGDSLGGLTVLPDCIELEDDE